jgi:hypothetical protein
MARISKAGLAWRARDRQGVARNGNAGVAGSGNAWHGSALQAANGAGWFGLEWRRNAGVASRGQVRHSNAGNDWLALDRIGLVAQENKMEVFARWQHWQQSR